MAGPLLSAVYAVVAFYCWRSTRAVHRASIGRLSSEKLAWDAIVATLTFVALTRPYAINSMLADGIRKWAATTGWYDARGEYQADFLLESMIVAAVLSAFFAFETRHWHSATRVAAIGAFILLAALIVDVVSLHSLDHLFAHRVAGVSARWGLDFVGLGAVSWGARRFREYMVSN